MPVNFICTHSGFLPIHKFWEDSQLPEWLIWQAMMLLFLTEFCNKV